MLIEGVKLFCFGASYAGALASEAAGIFVPARPRRWLSLALAAAGVLAHTIYLGHRAIAASICPLTTSYDSLLVLSWVLAVAYLSVHWYYPRVTVGIFALPLVLGLIGFAAFLGDDGRRVLEGWARIWGPIHGAMLAGGAIGVFVGFVSGVMYLVQARRLKGKRPRSDLLDLPSLELLERVNRQSITIAFPMLTVGLVIGLLLAWEQRRAGDVTIRLLDPKVIFGFLVWVAFAFLLKVRSQPEFRGRKVALLTIMAFCLLLFAMVGVDLLMSSWHRAVTGVENGLGPLLTARPPQVRDAIFAAGGAS